MSKRKWRSGLGEGDFAAIAAALLARLDEAEGGESSLEDFGRERSGLLRRGERSYFFRERDFMGEHREPLDAEGSERDFEFLDEPFGMEEFRKEEFGSGRIRRGGVLRRRLRRWEAGAEAESFDGLEAEKSPSLNGGVLTDGQELGQSGLPERLSEIFRRDSRNYDGAFERY